MTDENGMLSCEKCGSRAVPMTGNKGWRCGRPGNRWVNGQWTLCDWKRWNKSHQSFQKRAVVSRAEVWPVIAKPTAEQTDLLHHLSLAPAITGSRLTLQNCGAGTGKTTTNSCGLRSVLNRRGSLADYGIRAFNNVAVDVLASKLPAVASDIATLNASGGRLQGFGKPGSYDRSKVVKLFKEMVKSMSPKERPSFGKVGKVLERCRDLAFHFPEQDQASWNQAIDAVFVAFPSLHKKCKGQEKVIYEYVPRLAHAALRMKSVIDLQEQVTRPVTVAQQKHGWIMPVHLPRKPSWEWSDEEVEHCAKLIRTIDLPQAAGLLVDEGQDLSIAQLFCAIAQTWRNGELIIVGDDPSPCEPGEEGYKAGQGIYGWRGAIRGALFLAGRLWKALTGEDAISKSLTTTFRHGPEIVACYRQLNTQAKSALPAGRSVAWACGPETAFTAWLSLPKGKTALYITRTNGAQAEWFLRSLENQADCCIRGGGDFSAALDATLYEVAGWRDESTGEFKVSLAVCLERLKAMYDQEDDGQRDDPNSLESFLIRMVEAIQKNPALLNKANLSGLTVGNLRKFILHYVDRSSPRVIANVYRVKGDEADLVITGDIAKFNETWGDVLEDRAVRYVAASRAKSVQLFLGAMHRIDAPAASAEFMEDPSLPI